MNILKLIKFAKIIGKLKGLKRTGWVNSKIPDPESVAEHSFRLAVLAIVLAPKLKVDQLKVVKMALIHDIAEAEVGDIVIMHGDEIISDGKSKLHSERKALGKIFSSLDQNDYLKLFDEFERNETLEASIVKQLDKLEMAVQAFEYEQTQEVDLGKFFENTRSHLKDPYLIKILNCLETLRKNLRKN